MLLGLSLVIPFAEFLRLVLRLFWNSFMSTTSLRSLLNEESFFIGLREAEFILPEIKELELCRGALFEVLLCTIVRLLFFAIEAGT